MKAAGSAAVGTDMGIDGPGGRKVVHESVLECDAGALGAADVVMSGEEADVSV